MTAIMLTQRASIYRAVPTNAVTVDALSGTVNSEVYTDIQCLVVPISSMADAQAYAYMSTHVVWVPFWLRLRKEDELRIGRRDPDFAGDVAPWIYVINGTRSIRPGVPQRAYYCKERD